MFKSSIGILVAAAGLMFHQTAFATTNVWSGSGAGVNNWSTPGNWSLGTVPGPGDYVKFTDLGKTTLYSNVNNVVDGGFAGVIGSLYYANTNGFHTTVIGPGQTLVVTSNLIAGIDQSTGTIQRTNVIEGAGGSLIVSNAAANILIRDLWAPNHSGSITLDESGLDNFTAVIGRVMIGNSTAISNGNGSFVLARNSSITVSGAVTPAILVGGGGTNLNAAIIGSGNLILGQTNFIYADSVCIGSGATDARLSFNPGFANPAARFRGQDGVGRLANLNIGDGPNGGYFSGRIPAADFSQGTIDLQANILQVARVLTNDQAISGEAARGMLNISKGVIDVNTLQVGLNLWTNNSFGDGTVNVQGPGKLVANTVIELGHSVSTNTSIGSGRNRGILNISGGGSVFANTINANYIGAQNNTIAMTNGSLVISNSMGSGLNNFTMADSVFTLPAAGSPAAIVTNFTTGGSANIINIGALNGLNAYPTQVSLIKYTGPIGGSGFNLGLGTLPAPTYTGYLSNNAANNSVDLVLLRCPFLNGITTSGGQFNFNVASDSNGVVNILTSTNLTSWQLLTTVTNTTGSTALQYPTTNFPQQFFRAQETQ